MPLDYAPSALIDRVYGTIVNRAGVVLALDTVNIGGLIVPIVSLDWNFQTVAALGAGASQNLSVNTLTGVFAIVINSTAVGKLTFTIAGVNKLRINTLANTDYNIYNGGRAIFQIASNQTWAIKNDGGVALTFDIAFQFVQPPVV